MIKNIESEEGSVVLLALMVLLLITMFGFSALNNADTELIVAENSRCYKQNMYRAEGMVMAAAQALESSAPANLMPTTTTLPWLKDGTGFDPETDDWTSNSSDILTPQIFTKYPSNANYTVVFEGIAPGSSLSMEDAKMWQYKVFGKSNICGGETGIVAGYRRMF